MRFLNDFLRLQNLHKAATILKENKNQLAPFVKLLEILKRNNTRVMDIRYAMDNINNINALEQRKSKLKEGGSFTKGRERLFAGQLRRH